MPILITKPIKAQLGVKTTPKYNFTPQPSLDYIPGKQPEYDISGQVINETPKAIYSDQTDPNIPKGGAYRALPMKKNQLYRIALQGQGNVEVGDSLINLDDNKIHQLDMQSGNYNNLPINVKGLDKKKSNVNILKFFIPK